MSVRLRGSVQAEVYLKTQTFFSQQQLIPQGGTGEHVTSRSTSKSSNYLMQLLFPCSRTSCECPTHSQTFKLPRMSASSDVGGGTRPSSQVLHYLLTLSLGRHRYLGNRHNIKMFCRAGFKTFLLEFFCSNVTFYSPRLRASAPPTGPATTSAASTPTGSAWAQDCVSAIDELICIFHSRSV